MADIFISYARQDKGKARMLADALEEHGWSVWWDPRIRAGEVFDEVIEKALNEAKCVVVLWTKRSIKSLWVRTEATEGMKRGILVPALIENVDPPIAFRLVQSADLSSWKDEDQKEALAGLLESITHIVGAPKEENLDFQALPTKSDQSRQGVSVDETQKKSTPPDMVRIDPGPFLFGEDKKKVRIETPYAIDIYPVTNMQFKNFIDEGGYRTERFWSLEGWRWRSQARILKPKQWSDRNWNADDHPVVGVSWYEASAYASWAHKKLPTEQQWERAARGTDGRIYPWGDQFDTANCNTEDSGIMKTSEVGHYPKGVSPEGCYDMAGNIWEWTRTIYDSGEATDDFSPGVNYKKQPVIKGGSWEDKAEYKKCACRRTLKPIAKVNYAGFRCVMPVK